MTARSPTAALARRLHALAAALDTALAEGRVPESLRGDLAADVARWEALLEGGAAASGKPGAQGGTHGAGGAAQGSGGPDAGGFVVDDAGGRAPDAGGGPAQVADIRIWGDGSCAPNPGPGGWGAIIDWGDQCEELSGSAPQSTNNIMELTAMIQSLRHTAPGSRVHLSTDSQYVKNGITQWIHAWKRKGWRKADGKQVLNQDLWRALDGLCAERRVSWEWVRGHSGHPENERCDELANDARRALAPGR